tara:strand:+ start:871 stop:1086 length:216 start_codon:yes stop_codon:yes gene_type:complete
MDSFKENYIFPIYSKFYELQDEFINKSQDFKDEVQLSFKKFTFYLFIFLFLYYFKDFFFFLLRKFDKLLTS